MTAHEDFKLGIIREEGAEIAHVLTTHNEIGEEIVSIRPIGFQPASLELASKLRAQSTGRALRNGEFKLKIEFDDGKHVDCWVGGFRGFDSGRQYFLVGFPESEPQPTQTR